MPCFYKKLIIQTRKKSLKLKNMHFRHTATNLAYSDRSISIAVRCREVVAVSRGGFRRGTRPLYPKENDEKAPLSVQSSRDRERDVFGWGARAEGQNYPWANGNDQVVGWSDGRGAEAVYRAKGEEEKTAGWQGIGGGTAGGAGIVGGW